MSASACLPEEVQCQRVVGELLASLRSLCGVLERLQKEEFRLEGIELDSYKLALKLLDELEPQRSA